MALTYGRVVAREDGNSVKKDEEIQWINENTSVRYPAVSAQFRVVIPFSDEHKKLREFHCAPRKQFVIHLAGQIKITTSDGKSFLSLPGEIGTAEDTTGIGHISQPMSDSPRISIMLPLSI